MTRAEAKRLICRDVADILVSQPELTDWMLEHPPGDRDRLTRAFEELVAELYSRGDTERSREP